MPNASYSIYRRDEESQRWMAWRVREHGICMAWASSPIHHRVGEQKTGLPPFFLSIPLLLFTPSHVYSLSHTWTFPFLPFLILTIKHSTLIPLVCFFFTRTHSPPACLPLPHPPTPSPPFFFSPRIPAFFPFHLSRTTPLSSFPIGIVQSKRRMNTILQTSKGILSLCCCRRRLAFLSYDPQSSNVLNAVITVLVAPFKPPFKVTRGIFLFLTLESLGRCDKIKRAIYILGKEAVPFLPLLSPSNAITSAPSAFVNSVMCVFLEPLWASQ